MSPAGRTVAVIGGGIAGLSAAWELSDPGGPDAGGATKVIVLEGGDRLGGKLRTEAFGGREVEVGPDAFVARRPEALLLCRELGLAPDLVAPGTRRAYVWARGRLRPLPEGLALGVPTRIGPLARSGICSPVGLLGPALDLLRRGPGPVSGSAPTGGSSGPDEAVGEIVRRRLGREVTTRLAGPLIGGIHAGSVDTMSTAAVFPALLEADRSGGSLMRALRATLPPPPAAGSTPEAAPPVFLTVSGGFGRLVDELRRQLEERGVELRLDSPVTRLGRPSGGGSGRWEIGTTGTAIEVDAVVLAVPTAAAAGLLRPHDDSLADALAAVTYSSVGIITLRYPDGVIDHRLEGSGFLVPRGGRGRADPLVTACTWLTAKWPGLDRPGDLLLRASVGRAGDRRHEALDDRALVARVTAELGPMMGLSGPPLESLVTRWPDAFPQYSVGHRDRVAAIEGAASRLPSIALAGAALHGVGIPACIGSGRAAARALSARPAHRAGAGPSG